MKNLQLVETQKELLARIEKLTPETHALWGKMNVNQMICHITDPLRTALGLRPLENQSSFLLRTFVKWIVFNFPFMKNAPTMKGFNQEAGDGTPPTSFAQDKTTFLQLFHQFLNHKGEFSNHPAFGKLSNTEWNTLTYSHLDHHLRQFGV